ncbi:ABC-type cobalt transport system, ATPase component [Pyrobaculum sp. WP30]|nr:ABC-type cobalt transport system, ATPase component [Pyrobaculum sp. WP30]
MRREVLRASGLEFGYHGEPVLRGVELSVSEGEVVAIYGPTGSGKTTILLLLAGLLRPWRGEVYIMGERLDERTLPQIRRLIGISFQNPDDMFFNSTVLDEIAYTSARMYGADVGLKAARDIAEKLGISHILNKPPYKLSGGQKRLVALAAAVVHQPKLLLLDEPSTYLDEESTERVIKLFKELKSRGTAVLVATHDAEFICRIADKSYLLTGGRLINGVPGYRQPLCICGEDRRSQAPGRV